jgi:hypothetical protein
VQFKGQNEKNEKTKGGFWKEIKSFRKERVLIFYLKWGEGEAIGLFSFFSSNTHFGGMANSQFRFKKFPNFCKSHG